MALIGPTPTRPSPSSSRPLSLLSISLSPCTSLPLPFPPPLLPLTFFREEAEGTCERERARRRGRELGQVRVETHWTSVFFFKLLLNVAPYDTKIGCIQFLQAGAKKYKFSLLLCAVPLNIGNVRVCGRLSER